MMRHVTEIPRGTPVGLIEICKDEKCNEILNVLKKYNLSFNQAVEVLEMTKIVLGNLPIASSEISVEKINQSLTKTFSKIR